MTDVEELNAEIVLETHKLATAYAEKFAGDPEGELRAWLHIAARREAMVSDVYGNAERSYRLPEPRVPAGEVAWEAVTLIWQHEEVHTRFIEVRLKDGLLRDRALSAELMIWLGTMEGKFLAALTRRPSLRQMLSKLAVHLGALFAPEHIPEFTLELTEMRPREFFLLCAALETTARQSYARMEVLAAALAAQLSDAGPRSLQLENLVREFRLKTLDEAFHEAAFQEMAGWVVDGRLDAQLSARHCAQRLANLLPRADEAIRHPRRMHVRTDGGLGALFKKRGMSIVVD
jgi:hypothetical protein